MCLSETFDEDQVEDELEEDEVDEEEEEEEDVKESLLELEPEDEDLPSVLNVTPIICPGVSSSSSA